MGDFNKLRGELRHTRFKVGCIALASCGYRDASSSLEESKEGSRRFPSQIVIFVEEKKLVWHV